MKKLIALLLCVALALSLCACAESRQDETVPTEEPGATEESMPTVEEPPRETASNGDLILRRSGQVVDEPWPELGENQTANGYVKLGNYAHIQYVNEDGTGVADGWYYVPEFTLDSADAKACNQEIRELCDEKIANALDNDLPAGEERTAVTFQAWHWADVVSLSVECYDFFNQAPELIYNLDTQTGELLDNQEVARRAGIREGDYWEILKRTAQRARDSYLDEGPPAGYTIEHRNQSSSRENLEKMKLYMGENGTLMATVTIYFDVGGGEATLALPVEITPEGWPGVLMGLWEETLQDKQNADQYVSLGYEEDKTYTDPDGEEILCTYRLPKLLLKSTDAETYNGEIVDYLTKFWKGGVYEGRFYTGPHCSVQTADYRSWVWEDTLTVMVTMEIYDMAYVWCNVATFDLTSGKRLNNSEVFTRCTGQDTAASMEEIIAENLGLYFDQVHAQGEDEETIARRRENTITRDGMGMAEPVLYPGPDGELMALASIDSPMAHRSFLALVPMEEQSMLAISQPPGADATLEELVTVFLDTGATLSDSEGKLLYAPTMTIPQVNINTPDGRACNWRLQSILMPSLEMRSEGFGSGIIERSGDIGYDAWIWEGTLTLVVWDIYNEAWTDYYVYVFDLETGEQLDNSQVVALLSLTPEQASERVRSVMEETFKQEYTGQQDETYQSRLAATLAEGNLEGITLYPSAEGELMALCRLLVQPAGKWYLLAAD